MFAARKTLRASALAMLVVATATTPATVPNRTTLSPYPDILLVTVDTLRADHLSGYGHPRQTSPNLDRLFQRSVRFSEARTVEPLTNPSLVSMLTSLHPHEHGATRNGLRMRPGLDSLPKQLEQRGYRTAAIVGNWTLKPKLSGLQEHFEDYDGVYTRKRWFGMIKGEATAEDITGAAMEWIDAHRVARTGRPYFLWVHYVEPHAPYRLQPEFAAQVGITAPGKATPQERYDSEIAFVDHHIGRLLAEVEGGSRGSGTVVLFAADHGESLGEHGYWGHGRNLYDETLRIPMSVSWPGRLTPRAVDASVQNLDVAPTLLGLLGANVPPGFEGLDLTGVMQGGPAPERVTRYQAHKGAVLNQHESTMARRSGLLEIGLLRQSKKETFRVEDGQRRLFDLGSRERESKSLASGKSSPSPELQAWMKAVYSGLITMDGEVSGPEIDPESLEQLRSLGYVD